MPVSELDIVNSLSWLLGYAPADALSSPLFDELGLRAARDQAQLRRAILGSDAFARQWAGRLAHPANRALDLDRPRLVFLHLPKCGGTTLHETLLRHFAPAATCPERFNALRAYALGELSGFSFYSGHFDLESCGAIPGRDVKVVTMLREPHARLVSLYYFLKIHIPEHEPASASMVSLARALSAEDFFTHPRIRRHASVFNGMAAPFVQPLAGVRWESIDNQFADTDPVVADPVAAGERAFEALRALTAFGLVEAFSESLDLLAAGLGLVLDTIPAQQVTDEMRLRVNLSYAERPDLSPALVDILDDLTQADRLLYARAKTLFAARLDARVEATSSSAPSAFAAPRAIPLDRFEPRQARRAGGRIVASGTAGVFAVGPYMPLQHGRYRLAWHFARGDGAPDGSVPFSVNVWHNTGHARCASVRWTKPSPAILDFTLPFDVADLEFVALLDDGCDVELLAVELSTALGPGGGPA